MTAGSTRLLASMWNGARRLIGAPGRWLRAAPIADPVDRRNAPMLQIVLLLLGTLPPLGWLYRGLAVAVPWRPGELTSLALSLLFSAVALAGVVLIRWGRFRWAAYQLLVVFGISVCASYAASGFDGQRFEQPVLAVPLALAALAVGRPALWGMFATLMLAFWLGLRTDLAGGAPRDYLGDGLISATIFLLIAIILDRTSAALRQALHEARRHGAELGIAHQTLQREVDERRSLEEQLVNARKVEAVARLAAGLNHDFNHLLGLVLGYVRKGRRAADAQERDVAFDGIEAAATRATAVSGKLLNFSRPDQADVETLDLHTLVDALQPLLRQAIKPSVQLHVEVPEGLRVAFDRQQLELILLNLVGNADDAMSTGGRIELSARAHGTQIELRCRDTGPGIPAAQRAQVFEAFFSTKPGGTGLGLAMALALMQRHGASIRVDESASAGTTFVLVFPGANAPALSPAVLAGDSA